MTETTLQMQKFINISLNGNPMIIVAVILTTIGSVLSIGFGIWHFFVPKKWNWYSYIDPKAAELIVAIRAINVFFSLSLVLFGIANILIIYFNIQNQFSLLLLLTLSCVLWFVRSLLQIIWPQGSISVALKYGLLSTFIFVFLCYLISLLLVLIKNNF